jgi:DNA-binding transcriptional MerR regulator
VRTWKAGELAKRTGLTVRTLHHWDAIGLLVPSQRSRAGHRLYTEADVARLQGIVSLRQLGLSLEAIAQVMSGADFRLEQVLERQLEHVRERIRLEQALCEKLAGVARWLRSAGGVSVESLIELMEVMMQAESHFTPEQLEYLEKRRKELGAARIQQVELEWPELMAAMRRAMESGTPPTAEPVMALGRRWMALVREFTGGHAGVSASLERMYQSNLDKPGGHMGLDRPLADYATQAMKAAQAADEQSRKSE